jgi:hypothetical protein
MFRELGFRFLYLTRVGPFEASQIVLWGIGEGQVHLRLSIILRHGNEGWVLT